MMERVDDLSAGVLEEQSFAARVKAFLEAKEASQRLLDELMKLRQETESYATAHRSLDAASASVSALAQRLEATAGRLAQVIDALRLNGTP